MLRGAQIRKFLILHKELDPDDEEITRTRKVRRGYIAQKYAALIEALYGDGDRVPVEAQVTYEDGRTGTIRADVAIRDVGAHGDRNRRVRAPAEVDGISVRFGALLALNRVSLERPRAARSLAIIGPNGAGKTTLLNCISGFYQPSEGRIALRGPGSHTPARRPTWPRSASPARSRTSPSSRA